MRINPRTLTFWKWALGNDKQARARKNATAQEPKARAMEGVQPSRPIPIVEFRPSTPEARFELELGRGRRLVIPSTFDDDVLRRLLVVVGRTE